MSKVIATRAIRGAHQLVNRAEMELDRALEEKGPDRRVEFPNTGYFLPISHGILGMSIETLGGFKDLLDEAKKLLPPVPDRVFGFVLAFGLVDDLKHAQAAGAINYGFPTIADPDIGQILSSGICTYEHVASPVPPDKIVAKAIEVRGLKVTVSKVPIPVPYGPAFQGERVRAKDTSAELGGNANPGFEYVTSKGLDEVEDGKIEVIGPEIDDIEEGQKLPVGIWVEVAGRDMQTDLEPILERQIHDLINVAHGVFHMGQRDINWIRVSKKAKAKGFKFRHFGSILHAKLHGEYGKVFDKLQVKIYTGRGSIRASQSCADCLSAKKCPGGRYDRRVRGYLLLLRSLPILCSESYLYHHSRAFRPLRQL
jgi:hypothetical protein